jgi:hypothetical protein
MSTAVPSRQSIAAQYENYAIYILLSSRGAKPGFHWGIFMPTASPNGHVWHATNREGGWKLEYKTSANVPFSLSLVLAYKIGSIDPSQAQTCLNILNGVNAGGLSPNTGEATNCRVWVKDAIIALHSNRIIELAETFDSMETKMTNDANAHKSRVERGKSTARVENSGI